MQTWQDMLSHIPYSFTLYPKLVKGPELHILVGPPAWPISGTQHTDKNPCLQKIESQMPVASVPDTTLSMEIRYKATKKQLNFAKVQPFSNIEMLQCYPSYTVA